MPQKPIRILRLISRLNVGGPAIHTILLSDRMRERGYETRLVSGREGEREGNMYQLADERGVEPVFIESLGREINLKNDYVSYREICRQIHDFKPHIVHTHTAKAGTLGRIAAYRCKVPIILHTYHGHVLHGYFGKLKSEVYRRVERFLGTLTDSLIAISITGMDELVSMQIAPREKFVTIPLGLDLEKFRCAKERHRGKIRSELGLTEKESLVGIVARLVPIKNHYEFFEVVRRIAPRHPDIHFLVVGDGPLRGELEDFVKQQTYAPQVHFLGMREDLPEIYADLGLVILTSKNEGLPVALIEALASGTPIVGADVGATHELKAPFWASGTYAPGDVDHLEVTIVEWHEKQDDWNIITREMKDQIIRRYGIDRLVDDLDRHYRHWMGLKGIVP